MDSDSTIQKHHGIDFEYLSRQDVLEDSCFWNLVQCQKDSLYYFYVTTEKKLSKRASRLIKKVSKETKENANKAANEPTAISCSVHTPTSSTTSVSLLLLREEVRSLREFLESNEVAFVRALHLYDDTHDTNVYQCELDDLKETHTFLDGARLDLLFHRINQSINETKGPSRKVWKKQRRTSMVFLKNLPFANTNEDPRVFKQASPAEPSSEENNSSKKRRTGSMRTSLSSIFSFGKKRWWEK